MANDLTTQAVKNKLVEEINMYDKAISDQIAAADPSDTAKQVEIQKLRDERNQRAIDLQNVAGNEDNPNVLVE